jgi:hypothetical protein
VEIDGEESDSDPADMLTGREFAAMTAQLETMIRVRGEEGERREDLERVREELAERYKVLGMKEVSEGLKEEGEGRGEEPE